MVEPKSDPVDVSELTDGQLLSRFCNSGDELAFRTILERHGALVSSVCTAVLGNQADAEDAFQATFFVLARKARQIRKKEGVAGWLHRVALRSAIAARHRNRKMVTVELPHSDELMARELERVSSRATIVALHEQLDRLPEKCRSAMIAFYLEGLDQRTAARRLNISDAAFKKRVERGRSVLRRRLGALGIVGLTTAFLCRQALATGELALHDRLLNSTAIVAAKVRVAWSRGSLGIAGQHASLTLAHALLRTMMVPALFRSATHALAGACIGLVAVSAAVLAQSVAQPEVTLHSNVATELAEITVANDANLPLHPAISINNDELQMQPSAVLQAIPEFDRPLTQVSLLGEIAAPQPSVQGSRTSEKSITAYSEAPTPSSMSPAIHSSLPSGEAAAPSPSGGSSQNYQEWLRARTKSPATKLGSLPVQQETE